MANCVLGVVDLWRSEGSNVLISHWLLTFVHPQDWSCFRPGFLPDGDLIQCRVHTWPATNLFQDWKIQQSEAENRYQCQSVHPETGLWCKEAKISDMFSLWAISIIRSMDGSRVLFNLSVSLTQDDEFSQHCCSIRWRLDSYTTKWEWSSIYGVLAVQ